MGDTSISDFSSKDNAVYICSSITVYETLPFPELLGKHQVGVEDNIGQFSLHGT